MFFLNHLLTLFVNTVCVTSKNSTLFVYLLGSQFIRAYVLHVKNK